ncbi:MAG: SH3 domain-containing protein [Chloroflexi bacterium]|nr:SH3 domain-containing protein [Chloroflexota bacterium]
MRTQPNTTASIKTTLASGTVVKYTEQRFADGDLREWYRLVGFGWVCCRVGVDD